MNIMRQAAQNMDIEDDLRKQPDEVIDWLTNHSVMLTPVAQQLVHAEVARRLREIRGES